MAPCTWDAAPCSWVHCSAHSDPGCPCAGIHCAGRIVINMWRTLRSELKLNIYTFEACVAALLQLRTAHIPPWALHGWWVSPGEHALSLRLCLKGAHVGLG